MTKPKIYKQVVLRKDNFVYTTGWIEERGATVGYKVELEGDGIWEVIGVYGTKKDMDAGNSLFFKRNPRTFESIKGGKK